MTAAFLVVHKGRLIAERYAPGITKETQLESWSMGKSLAATLFGLLVKDGTYTLEEPAPVPLWRKPGDPRAAIRNMDLLRMSAGLKFLGNQEPGSTQTYPDGARPILHLAWLWKPSARKVAGRTPTKF
jgi:CubicO group peptidase (beta-lactamase class C family)